MLCLWVLKFHDAVFGAGFSSSHVLYISEFPYFLSKCLILGKLLYEICVVCSTLGGGNDLFPSKKLLPLRVHSWRAVALSVHEFCPETSARGSVCLLRVRRGKALISVWSVWHPYE